MAGPGSVAITGATGFLGWHLIEAFRTAGWQVTAVVRPGNTKPLPPGTHTFESTLDANLLTRALEGSAIVVHSAALTRARDDRAFNAVNVAGTSAVVSAANATGARVILISSQAATGVGTRERPSREDDPPRPVNAYGRSKLASEEVVKSEATAPWTILRPSSVYGPRDRAFEPLFRMASRGIFLLAADATLVLTLIYVEDAARAVVLAAASLAGDRAGGAGKSGRAGQPGVAGGAGRVEGQTLFVGHPRPTTTEELLRGMANAYQRRYRPIKSPAVFLDALARFGDLAWMLGIQPALDRDRLVEFRSAGFVCSVDRARDALNFTASVDLADGISRTVRWYRDHAWVG